jgi:aminocarboxymuconate-semialdehyde decarboxylase
MTILRASNSAARGMTPFPRGGWDLDRLLYDAVLHDTRPLQYLVDLAGPSRVLLGSDYPFNMGQYDIDIVRSLEVSPSDKASILCGNAVRLIGDTAASKAGINP